MPNTPTAVAWRTAREIADDLGVYPETVRRWAREGDPRIHVRPLPKRGRRYAICEPPTEATEASTAADEDAA